ncbi:hypothetical protein A5893_15570 [Pedobacter psychrophilus]|uniref:Nucleotidyltransferase n=1 Tax=Pedobacter psychrophilus TaxID=1826909 RepID=A0A179DBB8_9SPHI|nr:nucleotidyl transferase AbiEii/AbiGii toxin family protein [Pedobacter psychrophilus]OAQ38214.1 hypothetical protein A5893_15570 [Pedobacter psychrophilus]
MIKDWLNNYQPSNQAEAKDALREIMQEIVLAALYRAGFFEKAAFYGGTALRIFHGLDRFSEDLDFSLLKPDDGFSLDKYQEAILLEFTALGMKVTIKEKEKKIKTNINSAFLKSETMWRELTLEGIVPQSGLDQVANIKIKLEVDVMPPLGFVTEEKLSLKPFSFYVKCLTLPNLFAGKMHALIFRKWGKNVKGRDWYDMEWYIKKGVKLNLNHFLLRAIDSGDWKKENINKQEFQELLSERINNVEMKYVKDDIKRFIKNQSDIKIWSPIYFQDLVIHLKFEN